MIQSQRRTLENGLIIGVLDRENGFVAELVSFFQALKSGSLFHYLILLAVVLIGLALTIAAVAYQRVVIKRQTASKATQENFETIAADLRKRALGVKEGDEGLRKRELEVKERKQQQQVLKRSQWALKGSVSRTMLQNRFQKDEFKS